MLQVIPALNAGGAERTVIEVAQALTAAGWRALVASEGGRLEGALREAGGELVRMRFPKNPLSIAANARNLRRLARRERVDLIHVRSRAPAWSAVLARPKTGLPLVTTYHGAYSGKTAIKRAYNGVMARGDIVIANSAFMKERIVAMHGTDPARIRVIPRGVDLARFDPDAMPPERIAAMRAAFGLAPGDARPVILLPGRLTFWKGHDVAMQALAALPGTDAVLVFAGDGDKGDEMRARAAALGVADRVLLPGYVADMPAAYAASALVLAPSTLPEAFGRTAAEAQAMGVPVIAAGHGGALEVVQDGVTGLLAPPGDAAALAAAIRRVFAMTQERRAAMGNAARERIASLYTARALQDATIAAYRELLGRR